MKKPAILFLLLIFALTSFAQKPRRAKKSPVTAVKTKALAPRVAPGSEKEEFEKAIALAAPAERIAALQKFIENFPESAEKTRAAELVVSARAEIGDEKLRLSETAGGIELFKLAVAQAPVPVSDKLFSEILLQFPTNLFWRGERAAAIEIARMIEQKAEGNARQMLGLATFYLGTENAAEAKRLADKAIAIDAALPAAYQTLGMAHRLNFQLEESAAAYAKALELDQNSVVSKRSLAEMKRATGKADEAAALYREILAADENDNIARTGLVLSLFSAGRPSDAESEMAKALEANPGNLPLLVGAAYWYAAHGEGAKAVELGEKAVALEPRYTWAHIALARGLLQQKKPLEAERTLLAARQYGNFPTLDYEIATARMEAGFFREAVEILKPTFAVKGGAVETRLGGRVAKEAESFTELLALERRASIFEPAAADDAEKARRLKTLLAFSQKIEAADAGEEEIAAAAEEFTAGDDAMKLHRNLYAAGRLLQTQKALPKALELAQAAVGKTDAALDVPSAASAVMAEELYDSRTLAAARNEVIIVPTVPRQTLSAILRGRIEEITGWTLYQQNKTAEASVRLKRAVSVLPEKSAWWRSSMWRLGAALQADGKEKEALDAYLKSYPTGAPDGLKYSMIESLYVKINGNRDGLEARIGEKPASSVFAANPSVSAEETAAPANETKSEAPATEAVPPAEETAAPKQSVRSIVTAATEAKPKRIPDTVPIAETKPAAQTAPAPAETVTPVETEAKTEAENRADSANEAPTTENSAEKADETLANAVQTPVESVTEIKTETPADPAKETTAEQTQEKTDKEIVKKTDDSAEQAPIATPTAAAATEPVDETLLKDPAQTPAESVPETSGEIVTETTTEITTGAEADKTPAVEVTTAETSAETAPVAEQPARSEEEAPAEMRADETVKQEDQDEKKETEEKPESVTKIGETLESKSAPTTETSLEPLNEQAAEKANTQTDAPPVEAAPPVDAENPLVNKTSSERPVEQEQETSEKPANALSPEDTANTKEPAPAITEPVQDPKPKLAPVTEKKWAIITEETIPPARRIGKPEKTSAVEKSGGSRPLFESVVIPLPKGEATGTQESKIAENKVAPAEKPNSATENSAASVNNERSEEKIRAGLSRPRVIVEDPFAEQCGLTVSQERISLLNGGGSLGVLVGFAAQSDPNSVRAVSSSPADIEVVADPEVGAANGQSFFVIKSVSAKTGVYSVIFEAACGKKEVIVRVR